MNPKDHVLREVVNSLRDIAVEFHGADQLRARLRCALDPLLLLVGVGRTSPTAAPQVVTDERAKLYAVAIKAAEDWVSAEYLSTRSIGRGGPNLSEGVSKAEGRARNAISALAAAPVHAQEPVAIGAPEPEAVFAAFCEVNGYPSDSEMDEPLRKAFYEGIAYCSKGPFYPALVRPVAVPDGDEAFKVAAQGCIFGNGDVARAAKEWFKAGYKATPAALGDAKELTDDEILKVYEETVSYIGKRDDMASIIAFARAAIATSKAGA